MEKKDKKQWCPCGKKGTIPCGDCDVACCSVECLDAHIVKHTAASGINTKYSTFADKEIGPMMLGSSSNDMLRLMIIKQMNQLRSPFIARFVLTTSGGKILATPATDYDKGIPLSEYTRLMHSDMKTVREKVEGINAQKNKERATSAAKRATDLGKGITALKKSKRLTEGGKITFGEKKLAASGEAAIIASDDTVLSETIDSSEKYILSHLELVAYEIGLALRAARCNGYRCGLTSDSIYITKMTDETGYTIPRAFILYPTWFAPITVKPPSLELRPSVSILAPSNLPSHTNDVIMAYIAARQNKSIEASTKKDVADECVSIAIEKRNSLAYNSENNIRVHSPGATIYSGLPVLADLIDTMDDEVEPMDISQDDVAFGMVLYEMATNAHPARKYADAIISNNAVWAEKTTSLPEERADGSRRLSEEANRAVEKMKFSLKQAAKTSLTSLATAALSRVSIKSKFSLDTFLGDPAFHTVRNDSAILTTIATAVATSDYMNRAFDVSRGSHTWSSASARSKLVNCGRTTPNVRQLSAPHQYYGVGTPAIADNVAKIAHMIVTGVARTLGCERVALDAIASGSRRWTDIFFTTIDIFYRVATHITGGGNLMSETDAKIITETLLHGWLRGTSIIGDSWREFNPSWIVEHPTDIGPLIATYGELFTQIDWLTYARPSIWTWATARCDVGFWQVFYSKGGGRTTEKTLFAPNREVLASECYSTIKALIATPAQYYHAPLSDASICPAYLASPLIERYNEEIGVWSSVYNSVNQTSMIRIESPTTDAHVLLYCSGDVRTFYKVENTTRVELLTSLQDYVQITTPGHEPRPPESEMSGDAPAATTRRVYPVKKRIEKMVVIDDAIEQYTLRKFDASNADAPVEYAALKAYVAMDHEELVALAQKGQDVNKVLTALLIKAKVEAEKDDVMVQLSNAQSLGYDIEQILQYMRMYKKQGKV